MIWSTAKINKFNQYGFKYTDEKGEIINGHINHARSDYSCEYQKVKHLKTDKIYTFVTPICGTKLYYFEDEGWKDTLCDGKYRVAGFSQQQFINNTKGYHGGGERYQNNIFKSNRTDTNTRIM